MIKGGSLKSEHGDKLQVIQGSKLQTDQERYSKLQTDQERYSKLHTDQER
jgi:hypothetical protein